MFSSIIWKGFFSTITICLSKKLYLNVLQIVYVFFCLIPVNSVVLIVVCCRSEPFGSDLLPYDVPDLYESLPESERINLAEDQEARSEAGCVYNMIIIIVK